MFRDNMDEESGILMKKKWIIVLIVLIVIIVLALGGWKMGLFDRLFPKKVEVEDKQSIENLDGNSLIAEGKELFAVVDSETKAQEIAELYGIELVGFADGVAVYTTDEVPRDVILRGKEEGYPEISINFLREAQ